jgi:hypothetical protein
MTALCKQSAGLFIDRSCQQWVVRDPQGDFWILPAGEHPWEQRRPYHPTAETELEPVPGHYKDMLEVPY